MDILSMSYPELRAEAKRRGLSASGKRTALEHRLRQSVMLGSLDQAPQPPQNPEVNDDQENEDEAAAVTKAKSDSRGKKGKERKGREKVVDVNSARYLSEDEDNKKEDVEEMKVRSGSARRGPLHQVQFAEEVKEERGDEKEKEEEEKQVVKGSRSKRSAKKSKVASIPREEDEEEEIEAVSVEPTKETRKSRGRGSRRRTVKEEKNEKREEEEEIHKDDVVKKEDVVLYLSDEDMAEDVEDQQVQEAEAAPPQINNEDDQMEAEEIKGKEEREDEEEKIEVNAPKREDLVVSANRDAPSTARGTVSGLRRKLIGDKPAAASPLSRVKTGRVEKKETPKKGVKAAQAPSKLKPPLPTGARFAKAHAKIAAEGDTLAERAEKLHKKHEEYGKTAGGVFQRLATPKKASAMRGRSSSAGKGIEEVEKKKKSEKKEVVGFDFGTGAQAVQLEFGGNMGGNGVVKRFDTKQEKETVPKSSDATANKMKATKAEIRAKALAGAERLAMPKNVGRRAEIEQQKRDRVRDELHARARCLTPPMPLTMAVTSKTIERLATPKSALKPGEARSQARRGYIKKTGRLDYVNSTKLSDAEYRCAFEEEILVKKDGKVVFNKDRYDDVFNAATTKADKMKLTEMKRKLDM